MTYTTLVFSFLPSINVGIKVGHHFYSRAEMVAVGFHKQPMKGIDYIGKRYRKSVAYFV